MRKHIIAKLPSMIEKRLVLISRIILIGGICVLAILMLLTTANVFGRYLANHPIEGAEELIGLLFVCAATWGLAYCQIEKGHIRIPIVFEHLSQRYQLVIDILSYLLGLAGAGLICWQALIMTEKYIFLTKGGETQILGIPYYPFLLMLTIGFGFLGLMLLVDLLHCLVKVAGK